MTDEVCNIYYTDDDLDDQELFKDAVGEVSKYSRVCVQDSGDQLLELLKTTLPFPCLIFLDLNLPVKNGYQVLTELKREQHFKDLPVIIFTTSSDAHSIATTRELGANLYISKPTSYTLLKNIIRNILAIDWATFKVTGDNFVFKIS